MVINKHICLWQGNANHFAVAKLPIEADGCGILTTAKVPKQIPHPTAPIRDFACKINQHCPAEDIFKIQNSKLIKKIRIHPRQKVGFADIGVEVKSLLSIMLYFIDKTLKPKVEFFKVLFRYHRRECFILSVYLV